MLLAQSCPTVWHPVDCSPPGSSVHGILQARILEWVAFPSPRDLPNIGIESGSPKLQADYLPSEPSKIYKFEIHLEYIYIVQILLKCKIVSPQKPN